MRSRTPHLHLRPSFRGERSASPESITTTGSMDSGPAPSGASTMCNCTSGNDERGTLSSIFKQHHLQTQLRDLAASANAASRSRRAFRASFAINLPPSAIRGRGERRAPLAPAASCALCIGRKHTSNNEYPGITRRSRTQWFYGLLRALPGDRALLPPSSNGLRSCPRPVGPTSACRRLLTGRSQTCPATTCHA